MADFLNSPLCKFWIWLNMSFEPRCAEDLSTHLLTSHLMIMFISPSVVQCSFVPCVQINWTNLSSFFNHTLFQFSFFCYILVYAVIRNKLRIHSFKMQNAAMTVHPSNLGQWSRSYIYRKIVYQSINITRLSFSRSV